MSDVDPQKLARSGATAVHLFLAWCERRGVTLIDRRRKAIPNPDIIERLLSMILEGSDVDKLVAEWGKEQFGAISPLLEGAEEPKRKAQPAAPPSSVPLLDAELVNDEEEKHIDAVATAALARVTNAPLTMAVREMPDGSMTIEPKPEPKPAIQVMPSLPSDGRPCPNCRGSGVVPQKMQGQMCAVTCPTCEGTGRAPKPKQRGTACSCTARAVNPMCAAHGLDCLCPTTSLIDPRCPLHGRR